jgi:hypothetical protein
MTKFEFPETTIGETSEIDPQRVIDVAPEIDSYDIKLTAGQWDMIAERVAESTKSSSGTIHIVT